MYPYTKKKKNEAPSSYYIVGVYNWLEPNASLLNGLPDDSPPTRSHKHTSRKEFIEQLEITKKKKKNVRDLLEYRRAAKTFIIFNRFLGMRRCYRFPLQSGWRMLSLRSPPSIWPKINLHFGNFKLSPWWRKHSLKLYVYVFILNLETRKPDLNNSANGNKRALR